jgi:hypothetical protein
LANLPPEREEGGLVLARPLLAFAIRIFLRDGGEETGIDARAA